MVDKKGIGSGFSENSLAHFSSDRHKIISGVVSPLGFYTLALLIVEGFLIGAGSLFNLPVGQRSAFVWIGIVVFAAIIVIVTLLVVKCPRNLVFTDVSHIRYAQLTNFGTEQKPLPIDQMAGITVVPAPEISPQPPKLLLGRESPSENAE